MSDFEEVEILLAEDSDTDAEMTLRALRKKGIANSVTRVKDGASALDSFTPEATTLNAPTGTRKSFSWT